MGLLDWFKLKKREVHVHLHVHGELRVISDDATTGSTKGILGNKINRDDTFKDQADDLEPQLGDVKIPEVDFGDDINE